MKELDELLRKVLSKPKHDLNAAELHECFMDINRVPLFVNQLACAVKYSEGSDYLQMELLASLITMQRAIEITKDMLNVKEEEL